MKAVLGLVAVVALIELSAKRRSAAQRDVAQRAQVAREHALAEASDVARTSLAHDGGELEHGSGPSARPEEVVDGRARRVVQTAREVGVDRGGGG